MSAARVCLLRHFHSKCERRDLFVWQKASTPAASRSSRSAQEYHFLNSTCGGTGVLIGRNIYASPDRIVTENRLVINVSTTTVLGCALGVQYVHVLIDFDVCYGWQRIPVPLQSSIVLLAGTLAQQTAHRGSSGSQRVL